MLALLTVLTAVNSMDRTALVLVLQEIKVDLNISDTQIGLLSGLVFALVYSIAGVFVGRWADRGDRPRIVSLTTIIWSIGVASSAFVTSFLPLLMLRGAAAIGDAGLNPPAHSLIADHYDRTERARAVGVYMSGNAVCLVAGSILCGWLAQFFGWRLMFVILAAPGIALAALAWLSLREPRRIREQGPSTASLEEQQETEIATASWLSVLTTLWRVKTYRYLALTATTASFFGSAIGGWMPTYFIRRYEWSVGETGTWFGMASLGFLLGTYLGGELASRYATNRETLQLRAAAVCIAFGSVLTTSILFIPRTDIILAAMVLNSFVFSLQSAPTMSIMHGLVAPRQRARAIAALYVLLSIVGGGLGPLATGALSDALHGVAGEGSLQLALMLLAPGSFAAAVLAWNASTTASADLDQRAAEHRQHSILNAAREATP
ncbi:MFS transporter [Terricaulis silvestris]|nr:MFS transporter [Terricaulis silvestris]